MGPASHPVGYFPRTSFEVVAGGTTAAIDFALQEGGWITGTVTEAGTGSPIQDVHIDIFDAQGEFQTFGPTDANGDYTIYNALPPGSYYARAWAENPPHLGELHDDIPCHFECDVTGGTPIVVVAGASTDIDFELAVGGFVSGTVTAVGGTPIEDVHVNIHNTSGVLLTWEATDATGAFTTSLSLPAGYYHVSTSSIPGYIHELYDDLPCIGCDKTRGDLVHVSSGSTTTGIDFELALGGQISGTVLEAGTSAPIDDSTVMLYDSSGRLMTNGRVNAAGEHTSFSAVPTGTYYASTTNAAGYVDELYSETTCQGGGDFCPVTSGTPIAVTAGQVTENIHFTLLQSGGWFEGSVTDATWGHGLPGIDIEIYDVSGTLVSRVAWPPPMPSDGSFKTCGLPPGSYFAIADTSNLDPDYVDELYDRILCPVGCDPADGTSIPILEGQGTTNIDFNLSIAVFVDGVESGDTNRWSTTVP